MNFAIFIQEFPCTINLLITRERKTFVHHQVALAFPVVSFLLLVFSSFFLLSLPAFFLLILQTNTMPDIESVSWWVTRSPTSSFPHYFSQSESHTLSNSLIHAICQTQAQSFSLLISHTHLNHFNSQPINQSIKYAFHHFLSQSVKHSPTHKKTTRTIPTSQSTPLPSLTPVNEK